MRKTAIRISQVLVAGAMAAFPLMGSAAGFFNNQSANVNARARTTVISAQSSTANNTSNINQIGGLLTNQNAGVGGGASTSTTSNINAGSSNSVTIVQN